MPTKKPSGQLAWNGPPRTPPPNGERITTGSLMPLRQCVFAPTVTIGSNAHEMKSANCSSAIGPLAHPGRAEGGADEALLGDRRVDHALVAELLEQSFRDAERPAEVAHVLADQEDALVLAHGVRHR